MAHKDSALDSLAARASVQKMSVEEYLQHLLALESALFESVIEQGEASVASEGTVPLNDVISRLREKQRAANQSA